MAQTSFLSFLNSAISELPIIKRIIGNQELIAHTTGVGQVQSVLREDSLAKKIDELVNNHGEQGTIGWRSWKINAESLVEAIKNGDQNAKLKGWIGSVDQQPASLSESPLTLAKMFTWNEDDENNFGNKLQQIFLEYNPKFFHQA